LRHHRSVEDDSPAVTQVVAPRWPAAGGVTETVVGFPTQNQVDHALRQLDGHEPNDLSLRTPDTSTYLGICGGPERLYGDPHRAQPAVRPLINPDDPSQEPEDIMCGGQLTYFPRCFLVDRQKALIAAAYYLATAQADPTLNWEWH